MKRDKAASGESAGAATVRSKAAVAVAIVVAWYAFCAALIAITVAACILHSMWWLNLLWLLPVLAPRFGDKMRR